MLHESHIWFIEDNSTPPRCLLCGSQKGDPQSQMQCELSHYKHQLLGKPDPQPSPIRSFPSGACRDKSSSKPDYEGFLSPLVIEAFGEYMHFNRKLGDGSLRDSDNWQKGIPEGEYVKSLLRHVMDVWKWNRGHSIKEGLIFAACGVIFNIQGLLHEYLKKHPEALASQLEMNEKRREVGHDAGRGSGGNGPDLRGGLG